MREKVAKKTIKDLVKVDKVRDYNPKILNLINPDNPVQEKRNNEIINSIWERLRKRKDYQADYKKYFGKILFVFGGASKRKQEIGNYFKIKYNVIFPINPTYSFPDIFKKCETKKQRRDLEVAFYLLLEGTKTKSLINYLMPVIRHYLTDNKVAIQRAGAGQFHYESELGVKLPKVDLNQPLTDIHDVTICINLAASKTDIKKAVNDKIDIYKDWFEDISRKGTRNRSDKLKRNLEVFNYWLELKNKNNGNKVVDKITAHKFFPDDFQKNRQYNVPGKLDHQNAKVRCII